MKKGKSSIWLYGVWFACFVGVSSLSVFAEDAKQSDLDRSIQVYKSDSLFKWDREKAGGGVGPLLGMFSYTRHQTGDQDAFKEIGWLTLPKGAAIGLHKHIDNEDVYIIISGVGLFTDSDGKEIEVKAGDITIARPGQSHGLKNIGEEPLIFINVIAQLAPSSMEQDTPKKQKGKKGKK